MCILIETKASLSYVNPNIIESCHLQVTKFKDPWLVQLAIGAKRGVITKVDNYPVVLADDLIATNLNVFPLGSYDISIGMN